MANIDDFTTFAQSVRLVIKNQYFDDVASSDGQAFLANTADWCNMYLDELETETAPDGSPIDWWFARSNGETLGKAKLNKAIIDFDSDDFLSLIAEENRYVQLVQGGAVIANFAVVAPGQITNKGDRVTEDMCARVGDSIVFSRVFTEVEDGATIIGDVTTVLPRIAYTYDGTTFAVTDVSLLTTVRPALLLKLGVAKNNTLPDIVQGGLSPSFTQKYSDLLNSAIARSLASSQGDDAQTDDLSYIGGIGF